MSGSYNELADYLHNLSGLLVQHAQQPVNNTTIQQANQYSEALTAVYPLLLEKLQTYNTQQPILTIPRQPTVPIVAARTMTAGVPVINIPKQPTVPMTAGVPVINVPRQPTAPKPTNQERKQVPVVNIGDVGTYYSSAGLANPFRVINVTKNGTQIDILFDAGGTITLVWRDNKSYPANWYNINTKPWDVANDRKWGRITTYKFGIREQYDTTG
jgi:hypothetical protein